MSLLLKIQLNFKRLHTDISFNTNWPIVFTRALLQACRWKQITLYQKNNLPKQLPSQQKDPRGLDAQPIGWLQEWGNLRIRRFLKVLQVLQFHILDCSDCLESSLFSKNTHTQEFGDAERGFLIEFQNKGFLTVTRTDTQPTFNQHISVTHWDQTMLDY